MIAGVYNIDIDQGATFERLITVKNPDGTLYNLSNYAARMHIRDEYETDTFLASLTTENGGIVLGGENGTIFLYLSSSVTAQLERDCVYDLELIAPDQKVYRLIQGKARFGREVTR